MKEKLTAGQTLEETYLNNDREDVKGKAKQEEAIEKTNLSVYHN